MPLPAPASGRIALVTGASSGIGVEFARQLAERGHRIGLVARREDRLRELAAELGGEALALPCDLADGAARAELCEQLERDGHLVSILVNNAGFGGHGEFVGAEPGRDAEMVRLNVEAVTDLTARLAPAMAKRGTGAIINVASTAAFQPMPGGATYAATKAFVLSQSEALSTELKPRGVTVTVVCPGPVRTEFSGIAGTDVLEDDAPEFVWTSAADVAREAIEGVERGKRVIVPGNINRAGALLGRHAPRAALLPLVDRAWNR